MGSKYFEIGNVSKRELYDAIKTAGGLSPWNPITEPTKIIAGIYSSPGSFVLGAEFNGIIDDVSSSSKGTIIYFFQDTKRWGIISGEDKNKGIYSTLIQLQAAYPTANNGDYALVQDTGTFFAYYNNGWNNTASNVAPDSLRSTNNLNDLQDKLVSRTNLDVYNKKETKDSVGALLIDTTTIDFTYSSAVGTENITATIKDNSISNAKITSDADIATSKLKQATITPTLGVFSNSDTQETINNKAQGQITNLDNLLNTRPVGASNGNVYYLTSQPSIITDYELLSFSPDPSALDIESITINSTTIKANRLIGSYIANYEVGATVISGGNWLFNLYGYASNLNNSPRFEIDILKRTVAGAEALLFTSETANFLYDSQQANPELNIANVEKTQQDFACNTTDKVVIKIYAKTDRTQNTIITLLHSGADYASHIHTPLIASHNNLVGTQGGNSTEKYHLTLADYNKVGNLDNLLLAKEDAINKTTSFSAIPADVKFPTEKLVKSKLDLKEDLTNKVSAFSATPDDVKYPTEKLVKVQLDSKVDKITGKGLSTNDYTTSEQTKLAGITAGATVNSTDATLLARANHTGTQAISTIVDLSTNLSDKFSKTASNEITGLTDKATITDADVLMIDDVADTGKKKKVSALNNYNYINNKLQNQFNNKVGVSNTETIDGIKTFSNNITITAIPTLDNHSARLKDVVDSATAITNTKGQNNGIASLGADGKVPSNQLPAYVDDVLEYDNLAGFPATGDTGKIYLAKDTNKVYRWSGTQYVEISSSLALGETSSTAFAGDKGKTAYDHSQIATGNPHNTSKADVGLGNADNTSDANKPISTATQTALNLKSTSLAFRQESVRFIEATYGLDTNNGFSPDKPFQTITAGWNDVNPGGQVKVQGASTYNVGTFTFNASKSSIKTILDNGVKITGTINLVAGNTSMQFYNGKISATINDGAGSTCYFTNVDISGSTLNFSNGGYKFIGNSTSTPTVINLTGTGGTLVLQDIAGGIVPLNIGAGWVVVYYNCTPAILSNAGTIIDGLNIPINALIADQATLNAILAQTSSAYFGYYIVNFDSPVITGMTIAKGDVFYKVSATGNAKVYTFGNAPASFSLVVSATQRNTIVKSVDKWIVPTAGTVVVDGTKINTIATDVASASTVNLDNATGDIVNITGTTAITAITLSAGIKRFVRFAGILTLTNGASLVLPSGANITTAAGDNAVFIGYASGVVGCVSYERASGTALVGGAGSGDVSSVETSTADNQLVLYSGTAGKTIKKSIADGFTKLTTGVVSAQDKILGSDISVASSTANNFVVIGGSGTIADSEKKINNTDTPTNNDIWDALKTKSYIDNSVVAQPIYVATLTTGEGIALNITNHPFAVLTVSQGDAFATLPAFLNNSGKKMIIKSSPASVARLKINNSEKGSSYYLLSGDCAVFESDNTTWRLISGPKYVIPTLGLGAQTGGSGILFGYEEKLLGFGIGHQATAGSPFSPSTYSFTATQFPILDSDGSIYAGTITGWKNILTGRIFSMLLSNEGEVFTTNNTRFPRKIVFPAGIIIDKIYNTTHGNASGTVSSFFAITSIGKVYAWGDNTWGQLGLPLGNYATPTLVTALQDKVIEKISTSSNYGQHTAWIDSTRQLYMCGFNAGGALGLGHYTQTTTPTAVAGFNDVIDVVAVGGAIAFAENSPRQHTRVVRADGSSWASGWNDKSDLANNTVITTNVFVRETTFKTNIVNTYGGVAKAHGVSVVVTGESDYKVFFAGANDNDTTKGAYGRGDYTDITEFVLNATQLAAGFQGKMFKSNSVGFKGIESQVKIQGDIENNNLFNIWILDGEGSLYVSGHNLNGFCADGTTTDRNTFYKIKFPTKRRVVDFMPIGLAHASTNRGCLAVFEDGTMMTWGINNNGALGNQVSPNSLPLEYPSWVIGFEPFNK